MDLRVGFDVIAGTFGVPATVTVPGLPVISTTAAWVPSQTDDYPEAFSTRGDKSPKRREPRRVLALSRAAVPSIPIGALISAPEQRGGAICAWRVDGFDRLEPDVVRVVVVPAG